MPALIDHPSSTVTKLLLIGDPGCGKTCSLASLADAGYNLRIADLDNGLDGMRNLLTDLLSPYGKEAHKRVRYVTITERASKLTAPIISSKITTDEAKSEAIKSATVWTRLMTLLNKWEDLGPVTTWGPRDILVIDSLTLAGIAAYNFGSVANAGVKDNRVVYGYAQNLIEYLMQYLYSDDIKCNVIVTSHITFVGDEASAVLHGYPTTIGRALSPKIGRYFNSILMVKSDKRVRKIYTVPTSFIELKNSAPLRAKAEYEIKFGLAEFFKDVQGPPSALSVVA